VWTKAADTFSAPLASESITQCTSCGDVPGRWLRGIRSGGTMRLIGSSYISEL
jgi:hypothetical protein